MLSKHKQPNGCPVWPLPEQSASDLGCMMDLEISPAVRANYKDDHPWTLKQPPKWHPTG